jgi:beta-N-acetylhexosaminidase
VESKILIFTALLLCSIGPRSISAAPTFWDDGSEQEVVSAIISRMNDQELLGQVFMLGYVGQYPHLEFSNWIKNRHIGGVKIFSRNVKNLASLARDITNMQRSSMQGPFRIPLMVATDQEGGWVNHLKAATSKTAGNLALGATGLLRDSYLTGYYIGQELRQVGINMNFAPTIDVYSNPNASVIGPRAFSSDPRQTAFLAIAYFRGMSRQGIICTAKHFPGHGHADKDSHGTLPVINISFAEMWERELLPYRLLIKEGLPAIMSGHLAYPKILDNNDPSSLSLFFSHQVLREKMGFEGILVTDDLEMNGALVNGLNTAEAGQAALEAGNDMILISHTPRIQEQAWNRLLKVMGKEPAFRQRIEGNSQS